MKWTDHCNSFRVGTDQNCDHVMNLYFLIVGAFQGMEAIGAPPLRSIISKSVSSSDQGESLVQIILPSHCTITLWVRTVHEYNLSTHYIAA